MTLQNRVDPWGKLHAVPMRGALMGNRGILHNEARQIVRPWAGKSWVTCALQFGGIQRTVFGKDTYSELFFLDEATAFAAGHRPCNYCRKARYADFKSTWLRVNRPDAIGNIPITEIDKVLHAERAIPGGGKVTFNAALNDVPSGALFEYEGAPFLVRNGAVLRWSFDGYTRSALVAGSQPVKVLTAASIVRMYRDGFVPGVHAPADFV
jgi:hypothetical protein